jgi:hypothetical protein
VSWLMESLCWTQQTDSGLDRSYSGFSRRVLHGLKEMDCTKPSVAAPIVYLGNPFPASRKRDLNVCLHDLKP